MDRQTIEPRTRAQWCGEQKQSAQSYLTACTAFFNEAEIQQTTIEANPNTQILFDALRLRFLRFSSCTTSLDGLLNSDPTSQLVLAAIHRVMVLVVWSQEESASSNNLPQMRVPTVYAQTPEPRSRDRLHNVLTDMGNVHKGITSFTDSVTDRMKPLIKNASPLGSMLLPIQSLEDNVHPEVRSKLQHQCAEELKQVKNEKDFNLLASIAEDDEILRKEMYKKQSDNGHVYIENLVEIDANALYGDSSNGESQGVQRGVYNYYRRNKATGRAQAQYGNAYGQAFFAPNRPVG
ncbi:hypothetical protein MMC10_004503 [Thelotrema lepadinum]|nr:hypothetical protein [Thelotrema lepadinum]